MPNFALLFGDMTVAQALVWACLAAGLVYSAVKVLPHIKTFIDRLDAWSDLPGFMRRTEARLASVGKELSPNGGSSIKDSQRRTEEKVDTIETQVLAIGQAVATLAAESAAAARWRHEHELLSRDALDRIGSLEKSAHD